MQHKHLITLAIAAFAVAANGEVKVGKFRNLHHGIAGTVYAVDEHTLRIEDFEYDGAGPDAFFWVGTQGRPSSVGTILPYPFDGRFYEYEDGNAPILEGRFDKKEIKLTLPDNLKVSELKWMSVWCRAYRVNFGDIFFPDDLFTEEKEDDLPPPLVEPSNAHDPGHRHDGDADAESEPEGAYAEGEAESEAEAESGNGASKTTMTSWTSLLTLVFLLVVRS